MRKVLGKLLFMVIFLSIFSFSTTAFAEENGDNLEIEAAVTPLTSKERTYLIHVSGFKEEHVNALHPTTARELIEQKGKVVRSGEMGAQMEQPLGGFVPYGTIPANDVTMLWNIVRTTDDLSGYKKYYAISQFQWNKQPANYYVDKMSIGFPSHMGVFFKTSGGEVTQHSHQYYIYNSSTGAKTYYTKQTKTSDWDPSLGVVGAYDLQSPGSISTNRFHGGTISQYFYIRNTKVGENFNIKFQYGHARTIANVGLSYPISGISLTPSLSTDTMIKAESLLVK